GRGVLVKAAKRGQDRRIDLPSIGPRTVEGAARAGLAGIDVVAGSAVVAETERIGAVADRERLFVGGVRDATAKQCPRRLRARPERSMSFSWPPKNPAIGSAPR